MTEQVQPVQQVQHLLDRIRKDGVEAANRQAEELLAAARAKAAKVLSDAEARAADLVAKGQKEAEALEVRGRQALEHAARDLILRVGREIEGVVLGILEEGAKAALEPALLEKLLERFADAFVETGGDVRSVDLWIGADGQEQLLAFCKKALHAKLEKGVQVHVDWKMQRGFELRLKDGKLRHEITPPAIAEALAEVVRPRIAAAVKNAALSLCAPTPKS